MRRGGMQAESVHPCVHSDAARMAQEQHTSLTVWLALTPDPDGSGAMWTMLRPYLAEVLWKMV